MMRTCVRLDRLRPAPPLRARDRRRRPRGAGSPGPVALAPEPGREQLIGQASAAAEAYGVRAGLRLGEALARCPALRLVPPDPAGVADEWERLLAPARGHRRGGRARPSRRWRGSTRRACARCTAAASRACSPPRARALATPARHRRGAVALRGAGRLERGPRAPGRGRPVRRRRAARLPRAAARRAAGRARGDGGAARRCSSASACARSASWPRCRAPRWPTASARRACGRARSRAGATRRCARARRPSALEERLELPESASGTQLERALGLLIDRLLARRERRGRTMRAAVLSARLVEGGTWRVRVTFREALADPRRMRLVLAPRLADLPAPAEALRLRAEGLGPPAARPALPAVRARRGARGAGCARRSARRARSPGRRPRCGSCPWTRTRACPSGGSR